MTEPPADAAPPQVLLSAEEVRRRVRELAGEIARDHRGTEELVCLGVLKGSVFFLVDLVRELPLPVAVDFFQAASYGSGQEPGEVVLKKDVELPLRGRDVLLVEDIVDTGHTVATLLALLRHRRPRSLRLCALLDKPSRREVEVPIDYLGFTIPDRFVV
ncbi:MAG TPA: hypoxanthine phosphoribosyltransferase, partial [Thermoanaerobaculia bacterium]